MITTNAKRLITTIMAIAFFFAYVVFAPATSLAHVAGLDGMPIINTDRVFAIFVGSEKEPHVSVNQTPKELPDFHSEFVNQFRTEDEGVKTMYSSLPQNKAVVTLSLSIDLREQKLLYDTVDALAAYHAGQFLKSGDMSTLLLSESVLNDLALRQNCIAEMESRIKAQFVSASASIRFERAMKTDQGYEVCYYEYIELEYRYPNSSVNDSMAFGCDHCSTILTDGTIISDDFSEELVTGFVSSNSIKADDISCSLFDTCCNASSLTEDLCATDYKADYCSDIQISTIYPYNAVNAVAYANQYALNYNPSYPVASSDCANFVSQCLAAGGIPLIDTGYDSTSWKPGIPNWKHARSFVQFWQGQGYTTKSTGSCNIQMANCIPGNPVYWLNDPDSTPSGHIMICTGFNSNGVPYVNAHSSNVYHAPITNYSADHDLFTLMFKNCSHNGSSTYSQLNVNYHLVNCSLCGNVKLMGHTWITYSSYKKCSKCGCIVPLADANVYISPAAK